MQKWNTDQETPAEQFSYWREVLCLAFTALQPFAHKGVVRRGGFDSSVQSTQKRDLILAWLMSQAQHVHRKPADIRRTPEEFCFINLPLAGSSVIRQDGKEMIARPGDLYLVDITRPYELLQDEDQWHCFSLRLPRRYISPHNGDTRAMTAIRINDRGAIGMLTANYIQTLAVTNGLPQSRSEDLLISTMVSLLAEVFEDKPDSRQQRQQAIREGLYNALIQHLQRDLSNPGMSAQSVASHFKISIRYLHKLFEDREQSFARTLMEMRLGRCTQDLRQHDDALSISQVAYRWGFGDLSHFCRVFRKRYDMSPSEFRKLGQDGTHD